MSMVEAVKVIANALRDEERLLAARLVDIRRTLDALRQVCPHRMQPNGHDSHHNYERCEACGLEERDG